MIPCPLCSKSTYVQPEGTHSFYDCKHCGTVFRHPDFFLSAEAEKQRYLQHNNDVEDQRYQAFVAPIVDAVIERYRPESSGLDFGAGTGPVISKLLGEKGYKMSLWDPYFHPDSSVLDDTYDFIVCCEVMEHFYEPYSEFKRMKELLKPGGALFCMTDLLPGPTPFSRWHYKDDPTHVVFYSEENLRWIQQHLGFSDVSVDGRLIVFNP